MTFQPLHEHLKADKV